MEYPIEGIVLIVVGVVMVVFKNQVARLMLYWSREDQDTKDPMWRWLRENKFPTTRPFGFILIVMGVLRMYSYYNPN